MLANERTFAGWVRTSVGCIAMGVGFHALFNHMDPWWAARAIATWFLLIGVIIIWLAVRRAGAVTKRLNAHVIGGAQKMNLEMIAIGVSLGAAALAAAIWLLPIG